MNRLVQIFILLIVTINLDAQETTFLATEEFKGIKFKIPNNIEKRQMESSQQFRFDFESCKYSFIRKSEKENCGIRK